MILSLSVLIRIRPHKGNEGCLRCTEKDQGKRSGFISRGDDSGTHIKEQDLWEESGAVLVNSVTEIVRNGEKTGLSFRYPEGMSEFHSIGQGMGKTLTYAEEKQAYTLTDRGTYLKFKHGRAQGLDLSIMVEGDSRLFNPYGVIPVNPEKHPHVKFREADIFAEWLASEKAQMLIRLYHRGLSGLFP
jgi:tungstate transport system substrate-binding protein